MFHYQEKVCLLQLAANGQTYLIDPLVVKELSGLKAFLPIRIEPKISWGRLRYPLPLP